MPVFESCGRLDLSPTWVEFCVRLTYRTSAFASYRSETAFASGHSAPIAGAQTKRFTSRKRTLTQAAFLRCRRQDAI
jgi:hypothetical protein